MLRYFVTAQENIPPELGFQLYGRSHLLWLVWTVILVTVLSLWYRRSDRQLRRKILLGVCVCMLAMDLIWDGILVATDQFSLNYLPLDLCGIAMFGELLTALRPGTIVDELCYCLFLPGAMMALLFPNWTPLPFWNYLYLRSYLLHGLLVAFPIMRMAGGDFRPDARKLPRCLGISLLLCVPVYAVDKALDQNFFFLNTPSEGSPLELFAQWFGNPGYLIGLPVLLGLVWLLLYFPQLVGWLRRAHRIE